MNLIYGNVMYQFGGANASKNDIRIDSSIIVYYNQNRNSDIQGSSLLNFFQYEGYLSITNFII